MPPSTIIAGVEEPESVVSRKFTPNGIVRARWVCKVTIIIVAQTDCPSPILSIINDPKTDGLRLKLTVQSERQTRAGENTGGWVYHSLIFS